MQEKDELIERLERVASYIRDGSVDYMDAEALDQAIVEINRLRHLVDTSAELGIATSWIKINSKDNS